MITKGIKMKLFNYRGFSLISVLVATALAGALSLVVVQIIKNMNQGQNLAKSSMDELELRTEIRMILANERHCRVSLAGNGPYGSPSTPVTFTKNNIDEDDEGLNIELWLGNQSGDTRTRKRFSGTDVPNQKYGKIKIKSMKLIMNNGTGSNYSQSAGHSDIGELHVVTEKKISANKTRQILQKFAVIVRMSTNAGGVSTILSCTQVGTGIKLESGTANHNDKIEPITGYGKSDCHLIVGTGVPQKTDGAKKRSRHYGAYYVDDGSGWRIKTSYRSIGNNNLADIVNGTPQYLLICQ